jgi:hypothetical protein
MVSQQLYYFWVVKPAIGQRTYSRFANHLIFIVFRAFADEGKRSWVVVPAVGQCADSRLPRFLVFVGGLFGEAAGAFPDGLAIHWQVRG